jgi:hypothetical protein
MKVLAIQLASGPPIVFHENSTIVSYMYSDFNTLQTSYCASFLG